MAPLRYTEEDMANAIFDVTDNEMSQKKAAQKHGIPQTTLSGRMHGQEAREDQEQPAQHLTKNQELRLADWILKQEDLGYGPSYGQIRACANSLLKTAKPGVVVGTNWVSTFIGRHDKLKTKIGRRQEANRFDAFTPKAVNWYFDIREKEYGWIKPENTVNVDKGGILSRFGLDSLVVGSSDPEKKALLKSSQGRSWTTFVEAITADGRALNLGIIFKGKELQVQWFLEEFQRTCPGFKYICSENGWTDNHIGVAWLEDVYLPQTKPANEGDCRLIILDGHGSHASNNVFYCYLPAHCSHGLQPADNGVFNVLKRAYRKELDRYNYMTDSAPVDKVNFIRSYAAARKSMTKEVILSGWRVTGQWPISRRKALLHPEIQQDKEKRKTPEPQAPESIDSDTTPKTSRHVRDLGRNKDATTRRQFIKAAKGFENLELQLQAQIARNTSLQEENDRLKRGRKRKAIPNPNRRFIDIGEALSRGLPIPPIQISAQPNNRRRQEVIQVEVEEEDPVEPEVEPEAEAPRATRSGRQVKRPKRM